jgi:hypothetical protein
VAKSEKKKVCSSSQCVQENTNQVKTLQWKAFDKMHEATIVLNYSKKDDYYSGQEESQASYKLVSIKGQRPWNGLTIIAVGLSLLTHLEHILPV